MLHSNALLKSLTTAALTALSLSGCALLRAPCPPLPPPKIVVQPCKMPPTLDPRPLPGEQGTTYRDALLHRERLIEHGVSCELDKAAAREALGITPEPAP